MGRDCAPASLSPSLPAVLPPAESWAGWGQRSRGLSVEGGSLKVPLAWVSQLPSQYGYPGRQREMLPENVAFGLGLELPLRPHPGDSLYIRWHLDNLKSLKSFCTSCSRLCSPLPPPPRPCPAFWLTAPVFLPRKPILSRPRADPPLAAPLTTRLANGPADPPLRRWEPKTWAGMRGQIQSSVPPTAEGQPCKACLSEQGQTQGEV